MQLQYKQLNIVPLSSGIILKCEKIHHLLLEAPDQILGIHLIKRVVPDLPPKVQNHLKKIMMAGALLRAGIMITAPESLIQAA